MRAALYWRSSAELNLLLVLAKNLGYDECAQYHDDTPSNNSNRSGFKRMRMDARQNKFKAIFTMSLAAFSNESLSNILGYLQDLKKFNIVLITFEDDIDVLLPGLEWEAARQRKAASRPIKAALQRRQNLGLKKAGRPRKSSP